MRRLLPALAITLLPLLADAQTVQTITPAGLGYTVPIPVSSLTPVAGFRDYDGLQARYQDLTLLEDHITQTDVGASLLNRRLYAYRFSSASATNPEGIAKGGAVLEGTIHAREWASAEVVAGIFEWLALEKDTDPVAGYLLDNMEIVIHPLANPDGFLQTQRFPDKTINGGSTGAFGADGRMRRKNHRNSDEVLTTTSDYLLGVDLNRNHTFGWSNSSNSPSSIEYHGTAPGSEPESQGLYTAAGLVTPGRIRFYIDFHSYSQLYYLIFTNSAGHDTALLDAYTLMRGATLATSGKTYSRIDVDIATEAVGATDEYFGGTYGCMSYTLEIRPQGGEINNEFILPDSQIAATRAELLASTRAGLYYAAGPASLIDVQVRDTTGGRTESSPVVYHQQRTYTNPSRTLSTPASQPLQPGRVYTATLRFNKPMRLTGPAFFPGVTASLNGTVALTGAVTATNPQWSLATQGGAYGYNLRAGDTLTVDLDLTSVTPADGLYNLSVNVPDMAGKLLDADPRTVADWSTQGWTEWENGSGVDGSTGGADTLAQLTITAPASGFESWTLF